MMKNYMLSEYLVNQISSAMYKKASKAWAIKRIGAAANPEFNETSERNKQLQDEGSNKYVTWLKRYALY